MSGRYTYICEDCNERQVLSRTERANKFRSKCSFCGSLHLIPVSKNMVENREALHSIVLQERKTKTGRKRKRN